MSLTTAISKSSKSVPSMRSKAPKMVSTSVLRANDTRYVQLQRWHNFLRAQCYRLIYDLQLIDYLS